MPIEEYTPAVDAVGAMLRARTRTDTGVEVGTFNDDTRPTGEQVDGLIAQAVGDISNVIGEDLPNETLMNAAKSLSALGAAILVELSYFPEQVAHNHSPVATMERMYNARLKQLEEAVSEAGGVDGEVVPGSGGGPSYAYPEDQGGLVGWGTVW